jgi:uncharacterized protein YuzE
MTPVVTYNADVDAAYIRFSRRRVRDSEEVAQGIVLDYDKDGRIVGMEVLDAKRHLPSDVLGQAA